MFFNVKSATVIIFQTLLVLLSLTNCSYVQIVQSCGEFNETKSRNCDVYVIWKIFQFFVLFASQANHFQIISKLRNFFIFLYTLPIIILIKTHFVPVQESWKFNFCTSWSLKPRTALWWIISFLWNNWKHEIPLITPSNRCKIFASF